MDLLTDVRYSMIDKKGNIIRNTDNSEELLNNKMNEYTDIVSHQFLKANHNYINKSNISIMVMLDNECEQGNIIKIQNPTIHIIEIKATIRTKTQSIISYGSESIKSNYTDVLLGTLYPKGTVSLQATGIDNNIFMVLEQQGFELNTLAMTKINSRFRVVDLLEAYSNESLVKIWYNTKKELALISEEDCPVLKQDIHGDYLAFTDNQYMDLLKYGLEQPNSYILVAKCRDKDIKSVLIDIPGISNAMQTCQITKDNKLSMWAGQEVLQRNDDPSSILEYHIFEFIFNHDKSMIYLDGERVPVLNNSVGINDVILGIRLGNDFLGSIKHNVDVKDFMIIKSVLSDDDRYSIVSSLKNLYKLKDTEYGTA